MTIKTRVFNYGDEKESSWPPLFGTGGSGLYHLGEDGKLKEGPPPDKTKRYGEAPFVIQDTIDGFKHAASGEWIESRSKLRDTDRACGTITTDKRQDATPYTRAREQRYKRELKADIHQAMRRAINDLDNGMAPISEETRAKCAVQDEIVSERLGFDAFNVAGRKKDPRGKKYRRK